jgi:tetratricopeptide (TPR) repeat protein
VLLILLLLNGVVFAWRLAARRAEPPRDYYTYQVQRWEAQLLERPDDPVVWTTLAGLYEDMDRESSALYAYEQALQLDPGNPSALLYLGRMASARGDHEGAREYVTNAAEELPVGARYIAYFDLGELERKAGQIEAAIDAYEHSVADRGSFWNAHFQLAFLYEQQGRLDEALTSAESARVYVDDRPDLEQLIARLRAAGAEPIGEPETEMTTGAE